jgi:hypothetical protein
MFILYHGSLGYYTLDHWKKEAASCGTETQIYLTLNSIQIELNDGKYNSLINLDMGM